MKMENEGDERVCLNQIGKRMPGTFDCVGSGPLF